MLKLALVSSMVALMSLSQVCLAAHAESDGEKGLYAEEGHYTSDGEGGFYTPDGEHVMSDEDGGFYGLDGHYKSDGANGLITPNGQHITSDGNGGYYYEEVPLFGMDEQEANDPRFNDSILDQETAPIDGDEFDDEYYGE